MVEDLTLWWQCVTVRDREGRYAVVVGNINLMGYTFGSLLVLGHCSQDNGPSLWLCYCACGQYTALSTQALRRGDNKSCGCLQHRRSSTLKHGHAKKRGGGKSGTYISWRAMKNRCLNPNRRDYSFYGGAGIHICERWLSSFENFLSDMGQRPPGTSLDRINSGGDYEQSNCRWATKEVQYANRRKRSCWSHARKEKEGR